MKTILKISIFANLILVFGLGLMWSRQGREPAVDASTAVTNTPAPVVAAVTPVVERPTEVPPFRWSQLESADYRTYVNNLRASGCPATTLQAIVVADVHRRYEPKFEELEQQLDNLATNSWSAQIASFNLQQSLQAQLQKLPDAEAAEIADLMGYKSAPAVVAEVVAALPVRRSRPAPPVTPMTTPLVLQKVDVTGFKLNNGQLQDIADLRRKFLDQMDGPNQDTNDPAYQQRWHQAQAEADNLLKGIIGLRDFQQYQWAAENSAAAAAEQSTGP
jgi:hypothetical protein